MNLLHFFPKKEKISVESIVIVVECIFLVKLRIVCFLAMVQTDSYTRSWLVQCAMFHSLCPHFNFNCNKGEKTNCWAWVQLHFMSQFLCGKRKKPAPKPLRHCLLSYLLAHNRPQNGSLNYIFLICLLFVLCTRALGALHCLCWHIRIMIYFLFKK